MRTRKAAITVNRSIDEVRRLWSVSEHRPRIAGGDADSDAAVTFAVAPGDRGTEIYVELPKTTLGKVSEVVQKLSGDAPAASIKDELRRFKQSVETGVIPRSEGSPEGELLERKLKQHPAQPLSERELEQVGVR